jgi:hypothetical protein
VKTIQFLCIADCHNSEGAWQNLLASLKVLNIGIVPEKIIVEDDMDADHYSFQGSPSIKVDGIDLWESLQTEYHIGCRVYPTPEGLKGVPTVEMLVDRLRVMLA